MDKLITILPSSNGHFIAQQQGQSFVWVSALIMAAAVACILVAFKTRMWPFWLATGLLAAVALFLFFANRGQTYRMDITPKDAISYQTLQNGKVIGDANIHLENIASADIEYRRQDSRIVAVMRDGTKFYPMGDDWVHNEPQQFEVLNAIRESIGQIPATPR